jgi:putative FmdB family regulatory protein
MGRIIARGNRGASMPVYTYRCTNCGVQFDQTQKFTEDSLTKCPECGKNTLQKVYTPVGIVFKGSGFYATDHRSPSGQSRFNSDKKEESAAMAKTESSSTGDSTAAKTTEAAKPAPAPAPAAEKS